MQLDTSKFQEGAFSVPYNSEARAWNVSLDDIIVSKNVRGYFAKEIAFKDIIAEQHAKILDQKFTDGIYALILSACTLSISNQFRALYVKDENILRMPLVFKMKGNAIRSLASYNNKHLRASTMRNYLLDGGGDLEEQVDRVAYILYYYWFFKKDSIADVSNNVIIDLEEMIATLINDGFKPAYRNYNTANIVLALRSKIEDERLLHVGALNNYSPQGPLRMRR